MRAYDWKVGDDPSLVINFIKEVFKDLLPFYKVSGHWDEAVQEHILKKYSPTGMESFSYYDGKILHLAYQDVDISFAKMDMAFEFTFKNITVGLYEDYSYVNNLKVYNTAGTEIRYKSPIEGFEELLSFKGITDSSVTVAINLNQ